MPRVLDLNASPDKQEDVSQVEYQQLIVAWGTVVMSQLTSQAQRLAEQLDQAKIEIPDLELKSKWFKETMSAAE